MLYCIISNPIIVYHIHYMQYVDGFITIYYHIHIKSYYRILMDYILIVLILILLHIFVSLTYMNEISIAGGSSISFHLQATASSLPSATWPLNFQKSFFFPERIAGGLPSLKLTWHLQGSLSNRKIIFQSSIFRCELLVSGSVLFHNIS